MKPLLLLALLLPLCSFAQQATPAPLTSEQRVAQALTATAMRDLRPGLIAPRDFTLAPDGSIATYRDPKHRAQPTPEQLTAARATVQARAAGKVAFTAARKQMHDLFESLPLTTKARLRDEFIIINSIFDSGRADSIAEARLRVAAVQRPADSELTEEEFADALDAMLALFPTP